MILSIKSWRTKKKLCKPITYIYTDQTYRPEDSICIYLCLSYNKKRGPGPYNSIRHADNRRHLLGLALMQSRRKVHMSYLPLEVGKIWRCSCWEKSNFIMINEFKYGWTWRTWPSPLSLSLYSTFIEKKIFTRIFCVL